jgi:heptosyltransferase-2
LKRIKEWDHGTPLVLACRPGLGEFFLAAGLVDEVIEINKRTREGRQQARAKLHGREWDIIFVPHESPRTASWIWRLKTKRAKIGFKRWWNFLVFQRRVIKPMELPDALRQLSLLTAVDADLKSKFMSGEVQRWRNPLEQNSLEDFRSVPIPSWASMTLRKSPLVAQRRRVFLAPGSVWATKRWTIEGYQNLAQLLHDQGYQVELVGSQAEKPLCDQIQKVVTGLTNRAGTTSLRQLVELFAQDDALALVCNDSGAMHAAAIAGLPSVAIFGPTVLAQGFRPWQDQALVVQRPLACRPCGKHGSQVCPIGTHECMKDIGAPEVLAALKQLTSDTL